MRLTDQHSHRRRRSAILAALACVILLIAVATTFARLAPTAVAAPIAHARTRVSVAPTPSPTVQQATPTSTASPASASQPIVPCTASWCSVLNVQHWWLLGGPLIAVAGLVLLLAMRAEMRTARAGSRRVKRAANKAKRRAERKAERRAAWARLLRRKPLAPPVSHIWDDLPDETYPTGPLLPPSASASPRVQRASYTTARLPRSSDDERS